MGNEGKNKHPRLLMLSVIQLRGKHYQGVEARKDLISYLQHLHSSMARRLSHSGKVAEVWSPQLFCEKI